MKLSQHLRDIADIAARAEAELAEVPEKEAIVTLLNACANIEEHYKDWCKLTDSDFDLSEGETYRDGTSMEFYIESSWWHEVSLALRALNKA